MLWLYFKQSFFYYNLLMKAFSNFPLLLVYIGGLHDLHTDDAADNVWMQEGDLIGGNIFLVNCGIF